MLAEASSPQPLVLTVDLERCLVSTSGGHQTPFTVPPSTRNALLLGLDEIDLTLAHSGIIRRFEAERLGENPWI